MNESSHEILADLVQLYKDRSIHLTKGRVENYLEATRYLSMVK
jgi:hypothetical protein